MPNAVKMFNVYYRFSLTSLRIIDFLYRIFILASLFHLFLDASFKTFPALLSAVVFQSPMNSVLHHSHKLLVAQETISVVIEYLKNYDTVSNVKCSFILYYLYTPCAGLGFFQCRCGQLGKTPPLYTDSNIFRPFGRPKIRDFCPISG